MTKLNHYFCPYKIIFVTILFFELGFAHLLAVNDPLVFNNITTSSGLSEGNITFFHQDHEGFMWIGTSNGLNKYDGTNIWVYRKDQKDSTSLQSNYINIIFEDNENNLWIGTYRGLARYNRDQDNFERIFSSRNNGLFYYNTKAICEKDSNTLWIGTYNGCYAFNKKTYELTPYVNQYFKENQDQYFNIIFQDPDGSFWFSIFNSDDGSLGIFKLNQNTQKINHYYTGHKEISLKENKVYNMFIDDNGDIWIGYHTMGIDVFREGQGKISSYISDSDNPNSLSNNRILSMKKRADGNIIIGTNGGGLNIFDPVTGNFSIYLNSISERSILNNSVEKIYIGKDGMMWLGCWGGGISIFDRRFDKFSLYNTEKLEDRTSLLNNITCFAQDSNDKLWIATDGWGIYHYDPENEIFKNFSQYLSSNKILAIETDTSNGLWAGTWGEGLLYFEINGDQLKLKRRYDVLSSDRPNSDSYFTLFIDKKGTLWVGSFGEGLWFFNSATQQFEKVNLYNINGDWIDWMSVHCISEDTKGYIWVATELNGLFKVDPITLKSTLYVHDEEDSTSLINDNLNFVFEDSKKNLWIGFEEDGLGLFDRENNIFYNFNTKHGLPHNTITGILEGIDGSLWLSSLNGLSKVVPDFSDDQVKISCTNYSVYDGLQDRKFNRWAYFQSKSGLMYFGGTKGFNVFSPDNIPQNNDPPQVYLTDFLIFNKPVAINGSGSPLSKHISKTDKIVLKHNQSSITFKYTAVNFIFSERNQYAYYLEGFDADSLKWNHVGNSREATYTNLDPGEYIFRVKASNNDGVWNEKGASVIIEVLPPWWNTIWIRIMYVLTGIGILYAFIDYRISALKKQKVLLEQLVQDKTSDLSNANALLKEQQQNIIDQAEELQVQKEFLEENNKELSISNATKDKFFSIVAHDLINPFSTVLGFSEMLTINAASMDRKKVMELSKLVHGSAERVFLLLENLLQWSRAQTGKIQVKKEEIDIIKIVEENIVLASEMANAKNIILTSKIPEKTIIVADRNLLDTVIRNLLTNAIKFTENGYVDIYLNSSNSSVELCVKDTGIGISPDHLKNIFNIDKTSSTKGTNGESGTGLGLLICKEFVELNDGKLKVESKLGEGSLFIISLTKE